MGPSSGQSADERPLKGGGGGEEARQAGPPANLSSKPPPLAQGETELHSEKGGIALVGFTSLLIALFFFCKKKPRTTDQGGDRRACKRGSGCSLERCRKRSFNRFLSGTRRNRLLNQTKSLAEKIDKQTEVITNLRPSLLGVGIGTSWPRYTSS